MTSAITNSFLAHVSSNKQRGEKRPKQLTQVDVAMRDAKRRAASGEWDGSKGSTFIGLYAMCHEMVYGVIPDELYSAGIFKAAARNAANAMHEMFEDDPVKVVVFMRWAWAREKRKHEWAQQQGFDRNRMSWKWQFARNLLTDYRISLTQKRR